MNINDEGESSSPHYSSFLDPLKIEREDQILQTLLGLAGEFRAKMHELEYYNFLKPQNRGELEGIEQVIKNDWKKTEKIEFYKGRNLLGT